MYLLSASPKLTLLWALNMLLLVYLHLQSFFLASTALDVSKSGLNYFVLFILLLMFARGGEWLLWVGSGVPRRRTGVSASDGGHQSCPVSGALPGAGGLSVLHLGELPARRPELPQHLLAERGPGDSSAMPELRVRPQAVRGHPHHHHTLHRLLLHSHSGLEWGHGGLSVDQAGGVHCCGYFSWWSSCLHEVRIIPAVPLLPGVAGGLVRGGRPSGQHGRPHQLGGLRVSQWPAGSLELLPVGRRRDQWLGRGPAPYSHLWRSDYQQEDDGHHDPPPHHHHHQQLGGDVQLG